jgi:hypothetical protein
MGIMAGILRYAPGDVRALSQGHEMTEPAPYWTLIAVLFANLPLAEALAQRLYRAAVDLERRQAGSEQLSGDLAMGQVRRLGKTMVLGSISGPAFEADLDTPHGSGKVRFLVTQQALDLEGIGGSDGADPRAAALPAAPGRLPN